MIKDITATVAEGDGKTGVNPNFATVTVTLPNGAELTIMVHESLCYRNTINVEIDGPLGGEHGENTPHLRINVNEELVLDTAVDAENPYEPDEREPDLPDDDD